MKPMPPRIALDGCRNAGLCLRLVRTMDADDEGRTRALTAFAHQGRWYADHMEQSGGAWMRWLARREMGRINRICREEGIPEPHHDARVWTPAAAVSTPIARRRSVHLFRNADPVGGTR